MGARAAEAVWVSRSDSLGHRPPLLKGVSSELAERAAGDEVALNIEEIVHSRVIEKKRCILLGDLKPSHWRSRRRTAWLRDFGSVVLAPALLRVGTKPEFPLRT